MIKRGLISSLVVLFHLSAQAQSLNQYSDFILNSWAFKNKGEAVLFDLNPLQTYQLQARINEDIGITAYQTKKVTPLKMIKVAVLDTGIDASHPFLKNRISRNKEECQVLEKFKQCLKVEDRKVCTDKYLSVNSPDYDLNKNKYPADCAGWSILGKELGDTQIVGTPEFGDPIGHGTHVAGLIAAVTDQVQIIPVQVISNGPNEPIKPFSLDSDSPVVPAIDLSPDESQRGNFNESINLSDRIARGIIYAINAGADVINLSLGWPQGQDSEIMRQAIAAAQKKGIIIVAAAGNDSTTALLRPCQYEGVICIAASRPDGSISHFSNYGYGVDIAAPGTSIISTIPMSYRSIRLPGFVGVDILSGTSQASPLVAGIIAKMLAEGIPQKDIYPRLILGSRPTQKQLPVIVGPLTGAQKTIQPTTTYERSILSGLIDFSRAMKVQAQPLILKANKETHVIRWDRQADTLQLQFALKNYWKDISIDQFGLTLSSQAKSSLVPTVESIEFVDAIEGTVWKQGENRSVLVTLKVPYEGKISSSQMVSDLLFDTEVTLNHQKMKKFTVKAEIISTLSKESQSEDIVQIPVVGAIPRGMKWFLVDEIYDQKIQERDYFVLKQESNSFQIGLIRSDKTQYKVESIQSVPFAGDVKRTQPQHRIRMDLNNDGRSEYILTLVEYLAADGFQRRGDYKLHFFIFDDHFKFLNTYSVYDDRTIIPLNFSWMKVGQVLRPAWVNQGYSASLQIDITDLWDTKVNAKQKPSEVGIRYYYLNEGFKLQELALKNKAKIVDVIQPTFKQIQQGIVPVLIARNLGTEIKPSYNYQFSIGLVQSAQVLSEKSISQISVSQNYRNLLDTRVDKVMDLNSSEFEHNGTFWFSQDAHQKQRVTVYNSETQTMIDQLLNSQMTVFDSPLRVRAAYTGANTAGVFMMTNTEIEYHDLVAKKVAQTSLNKYTFIGDDLTVDLQFPITIVQKNSTTKLPALFTTEGSGLNLGVKMLVPILAKGNSQLQIVSPARLNFQSPQGCRANEAPVYLGEANKKDSLLQSGGYALDYFCGDKILRVNLKL